ncbi:prepilin-type N-terminal cleavage/methylation domain-containing protein [Pseudomonas sp. IT-347P]
MNRQEGFTLIELMVV